MRAPLHLPHRVLVPRQLRLAHAAHRRILRCIGPELHHAAVPDLDHLVDACAREQPRPILVPVERQHFAARRGHGERGRRERRGEGARARGGGHVCGRAEVEDAHGAVGGAGRDGVGLVRGEEGLVDAGGVGLERR